MKPHFLLLTFAIFCSSFYNPLLCQQEISLITRIWKVEKSSISGMMMNITDAQQRDYLDLRNDNTFVRVDEGMCLTGKWVWDNDNKKIKLTYQHNSQEEFFVVKKINNEELVLKLEEDWKNEMLMYLSAVRYPCSI